MKQHPLHNLLTAHPALHHTRRIVVAVSGGPDSLVLLHALLQTHHAPALSVFHLDHGLRGAASAADADFVRACCADWHVPCHVELADIRAEAPDSANLSEAARIVRYRRLARYAAHSDADAVVVAHTRDDQAETVLMRLLRGSGVRGLSAMARSVPWESWAGDVPGGHAALVRPLLDIDRTAIDAYVAEAGLIPRHDPSNVKQSSFRVRVRTQHLPTLRTEQPQLNRILATTAQHLREADDFIETSLEDVWPLLVSPAANRQHINRDVYLTLHRALQTAALRRLLHQSFGSLRGIDDDHIASLHQALLDHAPINTPLPQQLVLRWQGSVAIVGRGEMRATSPYAYTGAPCILVPGMTIALAAAQLVCTDVGSADSPTAFRVLLRADATYELRTRHRGDIIGIGHGQHKRLQDVFVDAKIPAHQRDTWPVVSAGDAVVWVLGVRVDPDACADAGYTFAVTGFERGSD